MSVCPHCQDEKRQVKSGRNRTGSQRYQCQVCRRIYTPEPNPLGYSENIKQMALKLYLEGNGFRRIGRLLGVNHQSVANWVTAAHAQLPPSGGSSQVAATAEVLEIDELFTFVATKKTVPTLSRSSNAKPDE